MAERRKLCAIMFTDIVGYTSLMSDSEVSALSAVREVKKALHRVLPLYNGQHIKEIGDGNLCIFGSSIEAASCALALQKWLSQSSFKIRIGLHLGDVVISGKDVYGDGVNIAARIESIAEAGSVLVSDVIARALAGHSNFTLTSKGTKTLKNVQLPVEVFGLSGEPLEAFESKSYRRNLASIALLIAVSFGAGGYWLTKSADNQKSTQPQTQSIPKNIQAEGVPLAVLPFTNLSNDPDQNYFSDGLSEELIFTLTRLSGLRVSARTSSFQFRDLSISPAEIAEQLGVRYLLTGSVRRSGDRLRVSTELLDVHSSEAIWNETFNRTLSADAIFDIQDEIAQSVSTKIPSLLDIRVTDLPERGTDNLDAYEAFLQAARTRGSSIEAFQERLYWLERALEYDPDYLIAEIELLELRAGASYSGYLDFNETMPGLKSRIEELLASPGNKPVQLLGLHGAILTLAGELDAAYSSFKEALEREPYNIRVLRSYVSLLQHYNRNDEVIEVSELIAAMDPLNKGLSGSRAYAAMYRGNFEQQRAYCEIVQHEIDANLAGPLCSSYLDWTVTYDMSSALEKFHSVLNHAPHLHAYFNAASLLNYLHATTYAESWWENITVSYYRLPMKGTSQWVNGDVEGAYHSFRQGYDLGRQQTSRTPLAQMYLAMGDYERAIDTVKDLSSFQKRAERFDRSQVQAGLVLGYAWKQLGMDEQANDMLERIVQRTEGETARGLLGIGYTQAEALALLGRTDDALKVIETLGESGTITLQHSTIFGYTPRRNPYFSSLKGNPKFERWLDDLDRQRAELLQNAESWLAPPET